LRVLLLQPRQRTGLGFADFTRVEPLGLLNVGGALVRDHEVEALDLFDHAALMAALRRRRPQAVGVGCSFTVDVGRARRIARWVKGFDPRTFVFVGGHHATLRPQDFDDEAVDAVVIGEGEPAAAELLRTLEDGGDPGQVRGLVLRRDGRFRLTGGREFVADLDDLPWPARELVARHRQDYYLGLRQPLTSIETSRGCPFRCTFCSVWRFYQGTVRTKSPERVVAEIAASPTDDILITDDNFLLDVPRARRIAELVDRRIGGRRRFVIQARSDTVVRHPDLLEQWRDLGLETVFIGFEKADGKSLEEVNKHNTPENNEQALAILRRLGVSVIASFIVDPAFRRPDFQRLRDYVRRLHINQPYFSVLTPLPGTELFDKLKGKIQTFNCGLFDLFHSVLPTALPRDQFYREMAGLYRQAYQGSTDFARVSREAVCRLLTGRLSLTGLIRLGRGARRMFSPRGYLRSAAEALRDPLGVLNEA